MDSQPDLAQTALAHLADAGVVYGRIADRVSGTHAASYPSAAFVARSVADQLTGLTRHQLLAYAQLVTVNLLAADGTITADPAFLRLLARSTVQREHP